MNRHPTHGRAPATNPATNKALPGLALLGAALLLAACQESKKPVVVESEGDSSTVVVNGTTVVTSAGPGESLELTAQLPAFAPPYPGAAVKTQITEPTNMGGKPTGSVVIFLTPDPVAKVAAFYDARAKDAGVKAGMIVNDPDSAVRIFGEEGGSKSDGTLIAISKSDEEPGTEIVITSGAKEAEVKQWEKQDWKSTQRPLPRLQ